MAAIGTTNKSDIVHFKEWMTSITQEIGYTTSRDGWPQLEWLKK